MASTYVNDLRLNEMATGDASGTWGTTTNTNLELIAEGLSFGTEAITTNADTHTSTVADGATDPARSIYIKYTGTLDSACTITIAPNTISRLHFIENGTSGSQNIIISQGSGANITIPAGDTKAVYLDGAGSGAAVVDAFASLNVVDLKVEDDLTVTDDLIVNGDIDLEGAIDVNGTANLDVVDIDGAVDMASTLAVGGVVTANAGVVVDNITIDGTEIDLSSGDLTIDVAGDIILDADGADVIYKDGGTTFLEIDKDNDNARIKNPISDGDIKIQGNDGGSTITALSLDMSAGGDATFTNAGATLTQTLFADSGSSEGSANITFNTDGGSTDQSVANIKMQQGSGDGAARKGEMLFQVSDNGAPATAMTISNNKSVTFASGATLSGNVSMMSNVLYASQVYVHDRIGHLNDADTFIDFDVDTIKFAAGGERMRIKSDGQVTVGTSNDLSARFGSSTTENQVSILADVNKSSGYSSTVLDVACTQTTFDATYFMIKCQMRGHSNRLIVADTGNVTNTNNSYGAISDQRLKTDIVDASSQWADIKAVKVRKFKYGMEPDNGFRLGVISQELEASGMNGLVQESDADEYQIAYNSDLKDQKVKEVKYSVLYMKAIKALQEAMTRIETLETKVKTLEDA